MLSNASLITMNGLLVGFCVWQHLKIRSLSLDRERIINSYSESLDSAITRIKDLNETYLHNEINNIVARLRDIDAYKNFRHDSHVIPKKFDETFKTNSTYERKGL